MTPIADFKSAKLFVMSILLASAPLAGCSDSYFKTGVILHLELIHKEDVAYLEVTVREDVYRQSVQDSARSVIGGWPNTTENRTDLEAVVFRITENDVTRFLFPGDVSMTPVGREMFIEVPNPASPRQTSVSHVIYVLEKENARLLDRERADAILAARQQLLERHYNKEGWNYFDTGEMRRLAESGKGLELDLGEKRVRLNLQVKPQESDTKRLAIGISLPNGDSMGQEFTYSLPTKSIDKKEWDSAQER